MLQVDHIGHQLKKNEAFWCLGYLMFCLELLHYKDDVLNRTLCEEIAAKFQISGYKEVTKILKCLHYTIGTIQYYDTDDLKDLVIKEPLVLLNK